VCTQTDRGEKGYSNPHKKTFYGCLSDQTGNTLPVQIQKPNQPQELGASVRPLCIY
jgi:hypothetical protein